MASFKSLNDEQMRDKSKFDWTKDKMKKDIEQIVLYFSLKLRNENVKSLENASVRSLTKLNNFPRINRLKDPGTLKEGVKLFYHDT